MKKTKTRGYRHKDNCSCNLCMGWNRGLTKETDERVKRCAEKISTTRKKLFEEGKILKPIGMSGKKHLERTKLIMSKSHIGKMSRFRKGKKWEEIFNPETVNKLKKAHSNPIELITYNKSKTGKTFEEIYGKEKAKNIISKLKEKGHYKKISKMMLSGGAMKARNGNCLKPNKKERILINLIKVNNLNFKYVGDGKLIIIGDEGCFNPDFVDKDNKLIIELFGDYWHNTPHAKYRDNMRLKTYSNQGYKTLVIWEHELKNPIKVIDKLKEHELEAKNGV